MAGGTFVTQNKILPGVYIRFKSQSGTNLTIGNRGIVTICKALSWGPVAIPNYLTNGQDPTALTGYDITNAKNTFIREIFKGTNRTSAPISLLLYRAAAVGSATASAVIGGLTVTGLYPGVRGNDINIIITALVTPADTFTVTTVVDGIVVDTQTAATIADLTANEWVTFTGEGALTASSGTPLTGGLDGTVEAAAFSTYLTNIEPYYFDVMIYDGIDATVQTAMLTFMERIADENGSYAQLVASGLQSADSRFAITVESGVTLEDGTALAKNEVTWWVGGATAGAIFNQALTYATYPNAVSVTPLRTTAQFEEALTSGQFVLFAENGAVKVMQDINTLTTFTAEISKIFRKNRIARLLSTIANDIYKQFSENYIGVVNNNATGRNLFKSAIVGYLLGIQGQEGIQNFTSDDVTVTQGDESDAIVVDIAIQSVDAVEKIYMTVVVS